MRRLFLFLKAYQPGLFDEQVTVSGHATKTGKYVQAYQAKRKKRHDEPQAGDLFAEAAAPKPKEIPGVDPATVTRLEKEVTAAKAAADRERAASERLHASDNIPGSLQAGGSNYSLGKKREAMNNRLADQHQKLQAAERRLRDAESKLEGYRSGEYHENGQPRADAPSRTAAKKAAKDYVDFIRATVKPGDRITFLQNPDSAHTAVKMNQKTITISGGTAWPYEDITPWIDGKPTTPKEAMQAFKRWREAESPAPEAPAPKPKEPEQAKRQAEKAPAPRKKPHRFNLDEPPHIQTLLNHAWQVTAAAQPGAIRPLSAMSDKEIAYGWAYSHAADQLARYGVHPKGYNERAHHHIIPQIRNKDKLDAIDAEMERRGLNDKYELDIGAYWEHAPGFKKSATIAEPADELIGEHRRLVRVLRSPSHADDLKEADEQESELREYEKKAKRKKKVCKAFLVAPLHQLLKARTHA